MMLFWMTDTIIIHTWLANRNRFRSFSKSSGLPGLFVYVADCEYLMLVKRSGVHCYFKGYAKILNIIPLYLNYLPGLKSKSVFNKLERLLCI